MLFVKSTIAAAVTVVVLLGPVSISAADLRRQVNTLDAFCTVWNNTCISVAHRAGKAYTECSKGYAGAGIATTNCYAVVDGKATDYNAQIVEAIGADYA